MYSTSHCPMIASSTPATHQPPPTISSLLQDASSNTVRADGLRRRDDLEDRHGPAPRQDTVPCGGLHLARTSTLAGIVLRAAADGRGRAGDARYLRSGCRQLARDIGMLYVIIGSVEGERCCVYILTAHVGIAAVAVQAVVCRGATWAAVRVAAMLREITGFIVAWIGSVSVSYHSRSGIKLLFVVGEALY